jgi:CDP-paratose 2-epimerase
MKRVLIIGGAGFIGVNTARHFAKKGWKITVFDNLIRPGTEVNLEWLVRDLGALVEFVKGDITTDTKSLDNLVSSHDVVIHLAAQVAVTTSIKNPREDFMINALGTFNVLEAVRNAENKPILLYASTNKVYGSLESLKVTEKKTRYAFKDLSIQRNGVSESVQLDFHSPYGCSKGSADQYVIDYSRIYNLRTVVFRQSCIYGEYQFGVEDQGWVAWFVIAAKLGKPITIFGNGKQVRDLLYIGDLVSLYERAVKNISKVSGQAFNVGGGPKNTLSLVECLSKIESILNKEIKLQHDDVRAGDQPIFVSDNRKLAKMVGWKPQVDVGLGLKRLANWVSKNESSLAKVRNSLKA